MAENFKLFSKAFGFTGKVIDRYDVAVELKAVKRTTGVHFCKT
ncbi:hypothetical protein BANRA_05402 [Escherichia coli]|nr:hypothetical protein BANRA_05402 [Escherichia coli]